MIISRGSEIYDVSFDINDEIWLKTVRKLKVIGIWFDHKLIFQNLQSGA